MKPLTIPVTPIAPITPIDVRKPIKNQIKTITRLPPMVPPPEPTTDFSQSIAEILARAKYNAEPGPDSPPLEPLEPSSAAETDDENNWATASDKSSPKHEPEPSTTGFIKTKAQIENPIPPPFPMSPPKKSEDDTSKEMEQLLAMLKQSHTIAATPVVPPAEEKTPGVDTFPPHKQPKIPAPSSFVPHIQNQLAVSVELHKPPVAPSPPPTPKKDVSSAPTKKPEGPKTPSKKTTSLTTRDKIAKAALGAGEDLNESTDSEPFITVSKGML